MSLEMGKTIEKKVELVGKTIEKAIEDKVVKPLSKLEKDTMKIKEVDQSIEMRKMYDDLDVSESLRMVATALSVYNSCASKVFLREMAIELNDCTDSNAF